MPDTGCGWIARRGCLFFWTVDDEKTFSYQAPDQFQFFGHVDVAGQRGDIEFMRLNDEAQERLAIFRAA